MFKNKSSYLFKIAVIFSGGICFALAIFNAGTDIFGWKFALLLLFAAIIAPQMNLTIPRSNFIISFSDPFIFLAFLIFGGEAAVILATFEMAASCYRSKRQGVPFTRLTIPSNIFSASLATACTFVVWRLAGELTGINPQSAGARDLILLLGILALAQFLASSILGALAYSLRDNVNIWEVWKRRLFLTSMTQIVGAALAGIFYKLIYSADFLIIAVTFIFFGIAYLNYRQAISEINNSVAQAERAESEKAEAERLRAEQAEKHIDQLSLLLKKEEQTSDDLRSSQVALEHAAFHDFLTDLPNRAYFVERLNLLIEIGIEISRRYYVLFLDFNRFKNINDSFGHPVGDKVLKLAAKRLVRLLRKEDTIARLGGDEFAIILNDLSSIDEAKDFANRIYETLTRPFLLQGNKIFTNLHIGIAPFDAEYQKPEDVLRDADIAMHYAKEKQTGIGVFNKELRAQHLEKLALEADLRFAVERGELSMHYQPLVCLADGSLIGFEALLRWRHKERGLISPQKFIPIAEDSGLIIPMTEWILQETCRQLAEWQKRFGFSETLVISVNISGRHLKGQSLIEQVEKALLLSGLAPDSLKLEITESVVMENAGQTVEILSKLKEIGVQLSIDDFGTGYSSLSYLHQLPFDTLKIDRSFVHRVGENGENSEILQTIITLAKNLRMRVLAEGIETEAQLRLLQNMNCDYGQGYLMSKPLPKDEMEELLYKKKNWLPPTDSSSDGHSEPHSQPEKENLRLF